jgi:hypothetical protein
LHNTDCSHYLAERWVFIFFFEWLKQDLESLPMVSPRGAIRILKLVAMCQVVLENTDQILTPISTSKLGHICLATLLAHLIEIDIK